jgi:hypothetical protein
MPFYKNTTNQLFWLEPAEVPEWTRPDWTEITPDEAEELRLLIDPPQIPSIVTMRQARLALLQAGLLDQVQAALEAIPDPVARQAALIEWEYGMTVDRNLPLITTLSATLNLTSAQVDQLFIAASQL